MILIFWNRFIKNRIEYTLNDVIVSEIRITVIVVLIRSNLYLYWRSIIKTK